MTNRMLNCSHVEYAAGRCGDYRCPNYFFRNVVLVDRPYLIADEESVADADNQEWDEMTSAEILAHEFDDDEWEDSEDADYSRDLISSWRMAESSLNPPRDY